MRDIFILRKCQPIKVIFVFKHDVKHNSISKEGLVYLKVNSNVGAWGIRLNIIRSTGVGKSINTSTFPKMDYNLFFPLPTHFLLCSSICNSTLFPQGYFSIFLFFDLSALFTGTTGICFKFSREK